MLAFNDYFGYEKLHLPQKAPRKSKRTQLSVEKLADLSDNSRQKKKQLNKILKPHSPVNSNRISFKRSPFKVMEKKNLINREYGRKEKSNHKRDQRFNHTYQRYYSEDCKTKKMVVEKRKDSLIRKYFERKKQEHRFQNKLEHKIAHFSESQPEIQERMQRSMNVLMQKNLNEYQFQPQFKLKKDEESFQKKQKYPQSLGKPEEIEKVEIEEESAFNDEEEDCILVENKEQSQNEQLQNDDYEIKKSVSVHHRMKSSLDSDKSMKNSFKLKMDKKILNSAKSEILSKIQQHSSTISKLLQFIYETNQFYQTNSIPFQRQNYLLKRMYLHSITKMGSYMRGYEKARNCFILDKCRISKEQFMNCKSENRYEIEMKVQLIEKEIEELKKIIEEESKNLIDKWPNDPYLHISKQNFEPELVNELYEEINSISEKLTGRMSVSNKPAHEQRRYTILCLIFLISELCEFKDGNQIELVNSNFNKFFIDNEELLIDIIQRFQDMPL